jgi:hypothetical protein
MTKIFSNGQEYADFLEKWCYRCVNYVETDGDSGDPCPIEESLAMASIMGEEAWPPEVTFPVLYAVCSEFQESL